MSPHTKKLLRAGIWVGAVFGAGTAAFMLTEGWGPWKAFYFTLITVTTVGHQDFDLSQRGQYAATFVIVLGIAAVSAVLGRFARSLIESELNHERRVMNQIRGLSDHSIVAGLGRIGVHVCEQLEDAGAAFVVIDRDHEKIERARERGWLALEGDATDDKTLMKCRIDRARAFATVTNEDSVNIVSTLTARDMAPDLYILSRAEGAEAVRKIARAGASRVISPAREGAVSIASNMLCPSVAEVYQPVAQLETLTFAELVIGPGSPVLGRPFRELHESYAEVVFIAVRRDGRLCLRPAPSEKLIAGESLVIGGPRPAVSAFEAFAVPGSELMNRAA